VNDSTFLRQDFEARIGDIVRLTAHHFRESGPEAREEAIQNTLGLCWLHFVRLAEQGRHAEPGIFDSMIGFCIRQTKVGRSIVGKDRKKSKDVIDYAKRRKNDVTLESVNFDGFLGRRAMVPDIAAFRIDTPIFLATLSERNRGIAKDLAGGMTTTEAAKKWGVSPGAISQFRDRFRRWYSGFHGEA
jgi:hypothetical protein